MIQDVDRYLRNDAAGSRLLAHAQLIARLDRRLAEALPPALAAGVRVANVKAGGVVLLAEHGAAASKVRQLAQRLARAFAELGVDCDAVEVRVAPRPALRPPAVAHLKPVSPPALAALRSTADTLPESPLKTALAQLLARVATTDGPAAG